jgi:tetratricopeptide (TPR) repeat protein
MSLRFRRSMKIAPGVRLNFSKSALGLSFGVPGARISVNTRGDVYSSAGIPGTGLYNVERGSIKPKKGRRKKPAPGEFVEQIPAPGLFAPRKQKALFRALQQSNIESLEQVGNRFPEIKHITDALIFPRLLMGTSSDVKGLNEKATALWKRKSELETNPLFYDYAKGFEITLIVAPGVSIPMQYGIIALGLAHIELLQMSNDFQAALEVAESLPANQATALAVCESELQLGRWQDVLETTEDIENIDEATALLLIYRAIALRESGLLDAAIETLRLARSSKKRHEDVLNKALYERAITYQKLGKETQARKDLEKIMATDSDFPGVTELLKKL